MPRGNNTEGNKQQQRQNNIFVALLHARATVRWTIEKATMTNTTFLFIDHLIHNTQTEQAHIARISSTWLYCYFIAQVWQLFSFFLFVVNKWKILSKFETEETKNLIWRQIILTLQWGFPSFFFENIFSPFLLVNLLGFRCTWNTSNW